MGDTPPPGRTKQNPFFFNGMGVGIMKWDVVVKYSMGNIYLSCSFHGNHQNWRSLTNFTKVHISATNACTNKVEVPFHMFESMCNPLIHK